jgi:hypothetical protein
MRFMMLMIPNGYQKAKADVLPTKEMVAAMTKYNDALRRAGRLISLDGLHPSADGARVKFSKGRPSVSFGPFAETNESVGGYWMIQAKSKEEAVEWASLCPAQDGDVIEIRQVQELSEFPPEIQEVAR